jgi:hypothetical protein
LSANIVGTPDALYRRLTHDATKKYIYDASKRNVNKSRLRYAGMLEVVNISVWPPADVIDLRGVFALEAESFKYYFACVGITE